MTLKRSLVLAFRHFWYGFLYSIERLFHRYRSPDDWQGEESVSGKIVVITGANSGLGKVMARQMAKRGATVVMACRNLAKTGKAIADIKRDVPEANLIFVKLDLEDMDSVRSCAARIATQVPQVDTLICNAGGITNNPTHVLRTKDGFERTMAMNHLGHFLLTNLLLDLLKKAAPSRIVMLTSMGHLVADLDPDDLNMEKDEYMGFAGVRPYGNAKLCTVLFVKELAKRLAGTGVTVYGLCPGLVDTEFFWGVKEFIYRFLYGALVIPILGGTPEQGVETILYCALSKECSGETGRLYRFRKPWASAEMKLDDVMARKVWDASEKLVGLTPGSNSRSASGHPDATEEISYGI